MFEGAWTSRPFHGDEWLFSSVLLPSYEKGDLVIGRLYEAIKNVCQSAVSNAIPKREREGGRGAGMVKRPFTVTLNSSLTALLYLSDNALVVKMIFILLFFFSSFYLSHVLLLILEVNMKMQAVQTACIMCKQFYFGS